MLREELPNRCIVAVSANSDGVIRPEKQATKTSPPEFLFCDAKMPNHNATREALVILERSGFPASI